MKCASQGCRDFGTHFPKVCVPATGHDIATHEPVSCIISLPLCREHAAVFAVNEWLETPTPQAGKTMRDVFALAVAGRVPPDFDRAFCKPVQIKSKEAQRFRNSLVVASKQNGANQPVSTES